MEQNLQRVVHTNYPDNSNRVYCRRLNKVVTIDSNGEFWDTCLKCPMYDGNYQGQGVECAWNDVDNAPTYCDNPTKEQLRVSQLIGKDVMIDLTKSMDKNGLVQVQRTVNGKHGTYNRMQWVRASDVQSTDKVVGQQPQTDSKPASKPIKKQTEVAYQVFGAGDRLVTKRKIVDTDKLDAFIEKISDGDKFHSVLATRDVTPAAPKSEASDTKSSYDEAFGKLPDGYMSASEDTKISYYNTQLTNKQKELSEAEKSKAEYEGMFVSGKFDGKIPESEALSNITFYKKKVDELNETIDKMKSALGDKAKQAEDKKPQDTKKDESKPVDYSKKITQSDVEKLNQTTIDMDTFSTIEAMKTVESVTHKGAVANHIHDDLVSIIFKDGTEVKLYVRGNSAASGVTKFLGKDVATHKFSTDEFTKLKSDRPKAIQYLKDQGVTWKETDNDGINWMRACMAASNVGKPADEPKKKDTKAVPSDSKKAVNDLLNKHAGDRTQVMTTAKAAGVTWKETDNTAINWMRASLAIQKHVENGGSLDAKAPEKPKADELKSAPKNVTIQDYGSYNQRGYSSPWVAIVNSQGKPDFDKKVGRYSGGAGEAGQLYVYAPEEGQLYMFGQKDYRGNNTEKEYKVFKDGKFESVSKTELTKYLK